MKILQTVLSLAVTAALALAAPQAPATQVAKDAAKTTATTTANTAKTTKAAAKAAVAPAPTAAEIADAKSKGMVWVNLNSKVFHKDGEHYGTTKNGKFMTAADATKAGYRAAKEPVAKVQKAPKTSTKDKKS